MNEEPHHERLTYVQHMRVFEIILPAGEMTRDHLRDHDVATLALGDATTRSRTAGGDWSAPMMRAHGSAEITAYTGAPAVHGMENVGATPVRMFVVENLRDAGAWSTLPAHRRAGNDPPTGRAIVCRVRHPPQHRDAADPPCAPESHAGRPSVGSSVDWGSGRRVGLSPGAGRTLGTLFWSRPAARLDQRRHRRGAPPLHRGAIRRIRSPILQRPAAGAGCRCAETPGRRIA